MASSSKNRRASLCPASRCRGYFCRQPGRQAIHAGGEGLRVRADQLGVNLVVRHLFDFHAAARRQDGAHRAVAGVEQEPDVDFASRLDLLLDAHRLDRAPFHHRPQDGVEVISDVPQRLRAPDYPRLAAPTGCDLALDDPGACGQRAEVQGCIAADETAARHRDAVLREQFLCVVLQQIHDSVTSDR